MAPAIPSTALIPTEPVFTNTERLALAGFLAGYSGPQRAARAKPQAPTFQALASSAGTGPW
jgi:hypothetical protein